MASEEKLMEILYKCGCCGYFYTTKREALRCESQHKSWRKASVEYDEENLTMDQYGSPNEIRLRNGEGKTVVYKRVDDPDYY